MALDLSNYKLTFDDEFNSFTSSPDGSSGWKTSFYFGGRSLPSNGEQEYYSDSSVGANPFNVHDGALEITAAPGSNPDGLPYNSGLITSEGMFSQTYGYFEMRAQLPEGHGLWPAFWMLPSDKSWPPELDALEAFGATNSRGEGGADKMHWGAISNGGGGGGDWATVPANIYDGYHTYGVDWQPDKITYYFDHKEIAQIDTPADMHKPMYMLANLAVGGNWAESPDGETAHMNVDYIRAYSSDPNADAVTPQPISSPDGSDTADPAALSGGSSDPAGTTDPAAGGDAAAANTSADAADTANAGAAASDASAAGTDAGATTSGDGTGAAADASSTAQADAGGDAADPTTVASDASAADPAGSEAAAADGSTSAADPAATDGNSAGGSQGSADHASDAAGSSDASSADSADPAAAGTGTEAGTSADASDPTATGAESAGSSQDPAQHAGDAAGAADASGTDSAAPAADTGSEGNTSGADASDPTATSADGASGSQDPAQDAGSSASADPEHAPITIRVSGDHWHGDPKLTLTVDGHQVGDVHTVTASHADGEWQDITVDGDFGAGSHQIGIDFGNDLYGGTPDADRNLYVDSIEVNGHRYGSADAVNTATAGATDGETGAMYSNGSLTFDTGMKPADFTDAAGHDIFVFRPLDQGQTIADFQSGEDVLDLAPLLKAAGYEGSDPIADHVVSLTPEGADATAVTFDPTGHDAADATTLATLTGIAPEQMQHSDFWF